MFQWLCTPETFPGDRSARCFRKAPLHADTSHVKLALGFEPLANSRRHIQGNRIMRAGLACHCIDCSPQVFVPNLADFLRGKIVLDPHIIALNRCLHSLNLAERTGSDKFKPPIRNASVMAGGAPAFMPLHRSTFRGPQTVESFWAPRAVKRHKCRAPPRSPAATDASRQFRNRLYTPATKRRVLQIRPHVSFPMPAPFAFLSGRFADLDGKTIVTACLDFKLRNIQQFAQSLQLCLCCFEPRIRAQ
jgi:hypothetical protein